MAVVLATGGVALLQTPAAAQTVCVTSPDGGATGCVSANAGQLPRASAYDGSCDGRGPTTYVKVANSNWYPVANGDGCNSTKSQTISYVAQSGNKVQIYVCNTSSGYSSCSSITSFTV